MGRANGGSSCVLCYVLFVAGGGVGPQHRSGVSCRAAEPARYLPTTWKTGGGCRYCRPAPPNRKPSSIKARVSLLLPRQPFRKEAFCFVSRSSSLTSTPAASLLPTGYFCDSISRSNVTSLSPKTPDFSLSSSSSCSSSSSLHHTPA